MFFLSGVNVFPYYTRTDMGTWGDKTDMGRRTLGDRHGDKQDRHGETDIRRQARRQTRQTWGDRGTACRERAWSNLAQSG